MRLQRIVVFSLAIAFGIGGATAPRMQAQSATTPTAAVLRLHVTSISDSIVAESDVVLKSEKKTAAGRTDSTGTARFEGLVAGLYRATIRRVGFSAVDVDFRIELGDNELTVKLTKSAATLDEVRVVGGQRLNARLDEFEIRRMRGQASSTVTRKEIERRNPIALSQMLRGLSGVRIADSAGNTVAVSQRGMKPSSDRRGRYAPADCILRITLDGMPQPVLSSIDAVPPVDVYGVEVFSGPARLPPQLAVLRTDNWCGLIAIWTRQR